MESEPVLAPWEKSHLREAEKRTPFHCACEAVRVTKETVENSE